MLCMHAGVALLMSYASVRYIKAADCLQTPLELKEVCSSNRPATLRKPEGLEAVGIPLITVRAWKRHPRGVRYRAAFNLLVPEHRSSD